MLPVDPDLLLPTAGAGGCVRTRQGGSQPPRIWCFLAEAAPPAIKYPILRGKWLSGVGGPSNPAAAPSPLSPFWCCAVCPRVFPVVASPKWDLHQNHHCWGAKTHGQGGTRAAPGPAPAPGGARCAGCWWVRAGADLQRGQGGRTAPSCAGSWPSPCFPHGFISDACFLTPPPTSTSLLRASAPGHPWPCPAPPLPPLARLHPGPQRTGGDEAVPEGGSEAEQRGQEPGAGLGTGETQRGRGRPQPGSGGGGGAVPWFPAQCHGHRPPFVPQRASGGPAAVWRKPGMRNGTVGATRSSARCVGGLLSPLCHQLP